MSKLIETHTLLANLMALFDLESGLAKGYQAKLDALPKTKAERLARRDTRMQDEREREKLEHSLSQLENGVTWEAGICFPELELLVGKPGLRWLRVQKGRLEREVAELQAFAAKWPTPETTRKFRYVGRREKYLDKDSGRYLEPGDVVELRKDRATNLRDLFEAVDETVGVG